MTYIEKQIILDALNEYTANHKIMASDAFIRKDFEREAIERQKCGKASAVIEIWKEIMEIPSGVPIKI